MAELLDDWIQCVIQAVDPWMSSKDIDRGALWFTEISDQLSNTSVGIVCLTKENKNKPWILFESGALAKGLTSNRVCTLLVDLSPADLENPLAQFNHTFPTKESLWDLARTINLSLKEQALKENVLAKVFDTYWPQFEEDFNIILQTTPDVEQKESRKSNDIMLDVLSTVRQLDKRMRNIEADRDAEPRLLRFNPKRRLLSPDEGRSRIEELIRQGFSEEHIVSVVSNEGPNQGWVRDEIERMGRDEIARLRHGVPSS